MVVYLLYSNWMHNGDNAVNEAIGVYDCLRKAQQSLCECVHTDLVSYPYEHIWGNGDKPIEDYDITSLSEMFYDDPDFVFDFTSVRLWNGDCEDDSEDYQFYDIEERDVL